MNNASAPRLFNLQSLGGIRYPALFLGLSVLLLLCTVGRAGSPVVVWGVNNYGQTNVPANLANAVMVASGQNHVLALKRDGTVVAWGSNSAGQTNVPAAVSNVVAIAGGCSFSLALRKDGTVIAWGDNTYGQTNVPVDLTNAVAIAGGYNHAVALRADGSVTAWGQSNYGQTNVPPGLSNIVAVGASVTHSLGLTANGTVIIWGGDASSLVNKPGDLTNVVAIAGGTTASASLALRAEGTVAAWGVRAWSAPASLTNATSVAAGLWGDIAIRADGTSLAWGCLTVPAGLSNVVSVASGDNHSVALVGNGEPFLTTALVDRSLIAGRTARLRASASGAWPLSYQWRYAGTNLPGATNAILTLQNVAPEQAGSYSVLVSNAFGTLLSPEVKVQVAPAGFLSQPASQTALLGSSALFTVGAAGPGTLAYQWQFCGTNISGATNSSLLLTNVQMHDAGPYSVTVTSPLGSAASDSAQLQLTQVSAWGDNSYGETNLPAGLTNLVGLSSGYYHNLGLRRDGTVGAWGNTVYNRTAVPPGLSNVVAVAGGGGHSLALKADGTVAAWGWNIFGQADVPSGLTDVVAIAAGERHSLALKADGTVAVWGDTSCGQTNVPPGLSNVVGIAAGGFHSLAVTADGKVVAWGHNYYGQSTIPAGLAGVIAVAAGEYHSLALKSDGTVVAWGAGVTDYTTEPYNGQCIVPATLSNVVAIAACGFNSEALQADGTVTVWGEAKYGQTNVPSNLAHASVLSAGYRHSVALVGDGPPVFTGRLANRTANYYSTVFLQAAATGSGPIAYQWRFCGTNLPGATNATLVLSNVMPAQAGAYSLVSSNAYGVTVSSNVMLAVCPTVDAQQTSQGSFVGSTVSLWTTAISPTSLSYQWQFNGVDLPGATNCTLVLTNLQLAQAGAYSVVVHGPAGLAQSAAVDVVVPQVAVWGLDSQLHVPGDLTNVVAVAGGIFHTLVLKGDGTVVAWGFSNYSGNDHGQAVVPAGLSNVVGIAAGTYHSLALLADGTVTAWGLGNAGQTAVPPDLTNAVAIAAGDDHSLALRSDGTVVAWGSSAYDQTAVPAGLSNVVRIAAAGFLSLALTADGTVAAWGGYSQPLVPPGLTNVLSIAAGGDHGLALRQDGTVVAWNLDGSLQTDIPPGLSNVVLIAANAGRNLALTAAGAVIAWPDTNVPAGIANATMLAAGQYHSLAVVRGAAPAAQVALAAPACGPEGFSFSLPTLSGRVYKPEYRQQLTDTNWTPLPLHSGSGGSLRFDIPAPAGVQGFYRVRQW